jgi:hypothetical protein
MIREGDQEVRHVVSAAGETATILAPKAMEVNGRDCGMSGLRRLALRLIVIGGARGWGVE